MRNTLIAALLLTYGYTATAQNTPADLQNIEMQKHLSETKDAKPKFGVKAGYNVARITGSTTNFSPDAKNGFMVSAFIRRVPGRAWGTEPNWFLPARDLVLTRMENKHQ